MRSVVSAIALLLLTLSIALASTVPQAANNQVCYDLDEATSTTRVNRGAAGSGWNMPDAGVVTKGTGQIGQAAYFDGGAGNTLGRSSSSADTLGWLQNPYTVSLWVYVTSTAANQYIFSFDTPGAYNFAFILLSGNQIEVATGQGFGCVTVASSISTNTWTHWMYINDGSTCKLYKNNTEVNSIVSLYGLNPSAKAHAGADEGGVQRLTGRLDSVMFWNLALDSTDRASVYNSGTGIGCSEPYPSGKHKSRIMKRLDVPLLSERLASFAQWLLPKQLALLGR